MRIEGIDLADVPIMASAIADDLVIVVQQNRLRLQSYQNLTSTYYAVSGQLKIAGISLPTVPLATLQPVDELVLIVENNALAVKQIGFTPPVMAVGSSIEVEGIGIPSVRFSGTIDGDEYVLAIRSNQMCLIPIPASFSAGALPTAGRTLLANLTSSLILNEGTGGPTYSMATAYWSTENDLRLLRQYPASSAFFGGARLVRNLLNTTSEDFSNAAWVKSNCTVTGTNTVVCANATSAQRVSQDSSGFAVTVGQTILCCYRVKKVAGGVDFIQIYGNSARFDFGYANFSLNDGSSVVSGCTASATLVAPDTYDIRASFLVTGSGTVAPYLNLINAISSARASNFTGDGIKSFELLRSWFVDVTGYNAAYVPEYVSIGVVATPFFGAGIDGAEYKTTDYQGAPISAANLKGFLDMPAATNLVLHIRDLSNVAWVKSNGTDVVCAKTATGIDGIANSASRCTWAVANGTVKQTLTVASAARCNSAYLKLGTPFVGPFYMTQDDGATWDDVTSQLNSSTYVRPEITSVLANPIVGFKSGTAGDVVNIDVVQNEAGTVATPPIVTTTATVSRGANSLSYQTASNIADAAGTMYIEAEPKSWANVSGGAGGSSTNGLLLSSANSGATAYDGTNAANGPVGVPSGKEKLAMRWTGSVLDVASSGALGTPGIYDGTMGLATIAVGAGVNVPTYFKNLAIYSSVWTDDEIKANVT